MHPKVFIHIVCPFLPLSRDNSFKSLEKRIYSNWRRRYLIGVTAIVLGTIFVKIFTLERHQLTRLSFEIVRFRLWELRWFSSSASFRFNTFCDSLRRWLSISIFTSVMHWILSQTLLGYQIRYIFYGNPFRDLVKSIYIRKGAIQSLLIQAGPLPSSNKPNMVHVSHFSAEF